MKETQEALKARILNGAIALFIDKGIEKLTTRELTEHLGISRSHIYHYFRDWETLCKEAMLLFMQRDREAFSANLVGLTAEERLMAYVKNYLPASYDATWLLYSSLWNLAIHDKEWAEMTESMDDCWQTMLAEIVAQGIAEGDFRTREPERVTRQLLAMVNGYADRLIIAPSPAEHQAATEDIAAFVRLALKAE